MDSSLTRVGLFLAATLLAYPTPASSQTSDKLTEFDYLLLGLTVRPEPEVQVVPRNVATGIHVELSFSQTTADANALLALLPSGLEVAAELVGPGIEEPIPLRAPPGRLLPVPPLVKRGIYLVRDIRLERQGEVFLRASPDAATVEVIDRVLITQVTTRPLTLAEIRQKGILFGGDDFIGFEFILALKLDSTPVNIRFPVIFDQNDVPIPIRGSASIDLEGRGLPIGNGSMVPLLLKPDIPEGEVEEQILSQVGDLRIPGLLIIPGDVGFLNQFFSALLLVSNGAPEGSRLLVGGLSAEIQLPAGEDQVPGTSDDPLEIAETTGGQAYVLPVLGVGPDGIPGTSDDAESFAPGEQGQAEFLLEGRLEGFHRIGFDINGILDGLPIGPVPLHGQARGGVLVRNPYFHMTFSAPATVRRGEEFSLYVTVTNISQAIANALRVSLDQAGLSGATLLGEPTQQIDTLLPGDSEVVSLRFLSHETGQVTASYLHFEDGGANTGELRFHLGVGERGVPLSPDTLVLPTVVEALPSQVVEAALRVLGQAWSVATAPTGTLPEGVYRISENVIVDFAIELAEAGFRVQVGEPLDQALIGMAFNWIGTDEPGFEQILRETAAGRGFFEAIGSALTTSAPAEELHHTIGEILVTRPPHLLLGVGNGLGEAPVDWRIEDASGRYIHSPGTYTLPNSTFIPFGGPGRGLALIGELESSLYELRFVGVESGELDLSISFPRLDGSTGFYVFSGVGIESGAQGRLEINLMRISPTLRLFIDRDGDGFFEETVDSAPVELLVGGGAKLIAATAIGPETLSGADPWGRVVALLFDREVRTAEASSPKNYRVEENQVIAATRQLSGRLVFIFLRDPVGNFVPRTVQVSGLFDATGRFMPPASSLITSRLTDPGAIVSGRVLRADGAPLVGAQVLYRNAAPQHGLIGISLKEVETDGTYSFDYVRQSPDGPFSIRAMDPILGGIQELTTSVRTNGEHIVVDLVLWGRGGVTGTVSDLSGNPVPGAKVLVTSQTDPASFFRTETDGNGRYVATGLVVGPVVVKAVSGTSIGTASGNVQRAGTFANVDVTLNADAGSLSGRVFELAGADVLTPLPQVLVYYLIPRPGANDEIVVASTETSGEGVFRFDNIPSGVFRILAVDRVTGRRASRSGTLVAGQSLENFDFFFTDAPEDYGTVEGRVLSGSGDGVAGAIVQGAGRQVKTDADGYFKLTNVAPGTHSFFAHEPDTDRTASVVVVVSANQVVSVTLAFTGIGQVAVTVLDGSGVPLGGQQVIRVSGGPCQGEPRVTNSSGVALFEDVAVPGGTFKTMRGEDVAEGIATIRHHGESASLTLRLAGFGTVSGTVLDPEGKPVHGADVVLAAHRLEKSWCSLIWDSKARQVQTGTDGRFVFERVPVGRFAVSASSVFFPVPTSAKGVFLADGDGRELTLTLASQFAGELSGTVFLPDGETPAGPGVSVTASSITYPDVTVATDTEGRYRFAKIFPSGPYTLTATDPVTGAVAQTRVQLLPEQDLTADLRLLGIGTVEVTVLDGAGDPVEEAFVELRRASFPFDHAAGALSPRDNGTIRFGRITEGEFTITAEDRLGRGGRASGTLLQSAGTCRVTVSLTVTGTVRGIFLNADGSQPIANAEVRLRQGLTGRLLGSTTTSMVPGELGTFEFTYVPAGTVLVTATDPLTGRIGEASGRIETEGETIELEIRQLGMGKVAGLVTSSGQPIMGAKVDLESQTGLESSFANLEATATSGSEGEFVFDGVPVGRFTLKATVPGLSLIGTASGVIETDGQEITDVELKLEPSGRVVGGVYRPDGTTAVPGAAVRLDAKSATLRTGTDASGRFRFDFVPVGDFSLRAEDANGYDAGIVAGALGEGEEIEIDVVFNGTGTVEGIALDSDGQPLSAGLVRLSTPQPFKRSDRASVATDGTFRFHHVPVGDFSLSLSVSGSPLGGTASGTIPSDGETANVTIQLADAGAVLGRILRPDGSTPAAHASVTVEGSGFRLTDLADAEGVFRIDGVPLGDFTARFEDPLTSGLAAASGAVATNGEEVDLGTLVLDASPIAVESISPPTGASRMSPDTVVVVRFTDPVEPFGLSSNTDIRSGGSSVPVSRELSADGYELTFTAVPWFPPRSEIEVLLRKDLADTFGRKLGTDFVSTFTTGGAVVTGVVYRGTTATPGAEVTLVAGADIETTTTDGSGRYRFEDVSEGTVVVQAFDLTAGLAGSAVVTLGSSDGVATADIALGFAGSVIGQVLRADSTPAGAGLEVVILQNGDPVALATTDETGRYLTTAVPLGAFTVDVTDPANGDRGRSEGSLTQSGATVEVDVLMVGVGAVRLFVRDPANELVPGAEATIRFTRFGQTTTLHNSALEPDGSLLFPRVLAGPFTAEAFDPITSLRASASGTAIADSEVTLDLILQASGTILGTVFAPDGATPVQGATVNLYRGSSSWAIAGELSDASGDFRIETIPVSDGPYRIDVFVDDKRRARARDIEVPADGEVQVDLVLSGLGTVTGQVLPPAGETLSSRVRVDLTSLAPDFGGSFADTEAADSTYLIEGVPVGPFRISARDAINGWLGESEGIVAVDGETVTVDVELIDNAISFGSGKNLYDANENTYRVLRSGALSGGKNGLFNALEAGGLHLDVTVDGVTTRFAGLDTGSQEESGRELVTALEDMGGLDVQRKIFVPREGYFARYLEIFENTTGEPIAVSAEVVSNINNSPRIRRTSNGDEIPDAEDLWIVINDENDIDPFEASWSIPSAAWLPAGENASLVPADITFEENVGTSDGRLSVRYDLELPPGERVLLMHLVAQQLNIESAEEAGRRLSRLPPEVLDGLSLDEIADIVNFDVPSDGTSSLAPLPPLDGHVQGRLFAHDEEHAIAGQQVQFQSRHPLFQRIRKYQSGSDGAYQFRPSFTANSSVVIPRVVYDLSARVDYGSLASEAAAAGDFIGRANLSRSPELAVDASSYSINNPPEKAFDGTSAWWLTATDDTANRGGTPWLEMALPVEVEVDRIHLDTYVTSINKIDRVRFELIGSADEVLHTIEADLPEPDREIDLDVDPAVGGVRRVRMVSLEDQGRNIGVVELEVFGTTTVDIGTAVQDLVFEGSGAIEVRAYRASGEGAKTSLNFKIGTRNINRTTGDEGYTFFAPIPPEASPVEVTATAYDNRLLSEVRSVHVVADTTSTLEIIYAATTGVSGRVLYSSGLPVAQNYVYLEPYPGWNARTDSEGFYSYPEVPSGNYTLRTVVGQRTLRVPITVSVPTPVTQDIVFPPLGTVNVTVLYDTQGGPTIPVPSALVERRDSLAADFGGGRFTNASGQTSLSNVAGTFTIRVRHPQDASLFTESPPGSIDVDGQTVPVTITIPSFGEVNGLVTFADGTPATGAKVEIFGPGITPQTTTTSSYSTSPGRYAFTRVEAYAPFTVRAYHPNNAEAYADAGGVVPGQGQTATADITLPKMGTVDVTVTEEDSSPIRSAQVFIRDSFHSEFVYKGVTDSAGERTITNVPEGDFTVRAEKDGKILGEASDVIAEQGEVVEVTIVRPADATIEGTVYAGDGATPIAVTRVELRSEDGSVLIKTQFTDNEGFYRFEDILEPGSSAVVRAVYSGDSAKTAEALVTANEHGEVITQDLELPVTVIKGYVLEAETATPVAGAKVEIQRQGTFETRTTTTGDTGAFSFLNEPEGAFEIFAEDDFGLAAFVRTGFQETEMWLEQDVTLPAFGTVEGTVRDAFGSPHVGDAVELRNGNLRNARSILPSEDGTFRFERVALGSFTVISEDSSYGNAPLPGSATGLLALSGQVAVADIPFPDMGTVFGQLLASDGTPTGPSGEGVRLFLEGRAHETGDGIYTNIQYFDSDGSYRTEDVPVGEITAIVLEQDDSGRNAATVAAGSETEIDVMLGTLDEPQIDLPPGIALVGDGSLFAFADEGYDTFAGVSIDGKSFPYLAGGDTELSARQVVLGPIANAGILHTRKVYSPEGTNYLRYLEIFDNPRSFDVEVRLDWGGTATARSTSSGDDRLDPTDRFFIEPYYDLAVVYGGEGDSALAPDNARSRPGRCEIEWRKLTVPAGGRVIVMHFIAFGADPADAEAQADTLMRLADPTAFSDLSAAERARIVNFEVPQP